MSVCGESNEALHVGKKYTPNTLYIFLILRKVSVCGEANEVLHVGKKHTPDILYISLIL